jgi:Cu-Zn family superoxide dismutase
MAATAKSVSKSKTSESNNIKLVLSVVAGLLVIALGAIFVLQSSAAAPLAKASLVNQAGAVIGEVVFKGPKTYADRVEIKINAPGAPALGSFHGLHVHTTGVCNPQPSGTLNVPFGSSGGHWNPTGANHGQHAGDLPSALITAEGETYAEFETDRFNVTELLDAAGDGSAVVLHAGPDNFANIPAAYGTPNAATLNTGDAGGRYACGIVKAVQ